MVKNQITSTNIDHRLPSRVEPETADDRMCVQWKSIYKIIHVTKFVATAGTLR